MLYKYAHSTQQNKETEMDPELDTTATARILALCLIRARMRKAEDRDTKEQVKTMKSTDK